MRSHKFKRYCSVCQTPVIAHSMCKQCLRDKAALEKRAAAATIAVQNYRDYTAARNAAIEKVNCDFYGSDFPEKLKELWSRLPTEPAAVSAEANKWLGVSHPDAMRISHEAMLLVRKKVIPTPPAKATVELSTPMFNTKLHYNQWLIITSPYKITPLKGDYWGRSGPETGVSKRSLTLIQSDKEAVLLSWTGSSVNIVLCFGFEDDHVVAKTIENKYFSPQKLKMLNCISTMTQWENAVKSLRPSRGTTLESVVMKITAWKGKVTTWFEITTSVPNPTAYLYFRAARKFKGERFSRLMDGYQKWSTQRPTITYVARCFNHTQVAKINRYSWDEMTAGMAPVVKAAK